MRRKIKKCELKDTEGTVLYFLPLCNRKGINVKKQTQQILEFWSGDRNIQPVVDFGFLMRTVLSVEKLRFIVHGSSNSKESVFWSAS